MIPNSDRAAFRCMFIVIRMGEMSPYKVAAEINAGLERQSNMEVGKTVRHPDGRNVKIKSGQFLSNGRVSNFWYWNEVKADGTLGPEEHGYGW